ncbi:hypothetical protein D3C87_1264030 [compost metagenome]
MNNRKSPIWGLGESLEKIEAFNRRELPMNKLQEIREALEAATPGPWEWSVKEWTLNKHDGLDIGNLEHKIGAKSAELVLCIENNRYGHPVITTGEKANANLIANAPEYLSYLLQLVETQAKVINEAVQIWETQDMEDDPVDVVERMIATLKVPTYLGTL